jgi:hypothetical protein
MARKVLLETGYTFNPTTAIVSATGTVGLIVASATSPWSGTITGMTTTAGLGVGSFFTATAGTGSVGTGGTYRVTSILSPTSITFSSIGGTTPTAGTITNITPTAKQIVIPRHIPRERLVLITNVTNNQVIYNFSDPSLSATTYNAIMYGAQGYTTLVLSYNTVAMAATDRLQITIDEYSEKFEPAETHLDPANKFRTSSPQSLIDTDFEYGTQNTKWENIATVNNRPWAYESQVPLTNVTAIAMSAGARVVTVSTATPPAVGTPIFIRDTNLPFANGNFIVESVSAGVSFTYTARSVNYTSITALFDASKTIVTAGTLFTGSAIGTAPTFTISGTDLKVRVTTTVAHGLFPGNEIAVTGISGTNPPNGNHTVATVVSPTIFEYYANPAIGNPATLTTTSAAVYTRPQSQALHRPFDGGVLFSTNSSSNNISATRQTRRYFRYQSGKGLQMSSGTVLRPYASIDQVTSSGSTVTVRTREAHGIQPGTVVTLSGANESAYNGTFTVVSAPRFNTFTYTTVGAVTPTASPASGDVNLAVISWYGAKNRLGAFDAQNGMFFEYDGQTLWAVRRASTYQIAGRVSVAAGANTVTQTDAEYATGFAKQLRVNDFITIRGQSYKVIDIASDTSMTISPSYRGSTNVTYGTVTKAVETRVAQSSFNIDKLDGTGPSGYNLDLSKMQMFYIDYTWYGAGFVRWGVRGPNGDVIYCHKLPNNNVNSEAHMRSGNLPARYESVTESPFTTTTSTVGTTDTTLNVADTSLFPPTGTLIIRNGSTYEGVNYTGKTATQFTGVTRTLAGSAVTGTATTWSSGAVSGTVTTATGIQVGQRVHSTTNPNPVPEGTFVTSVVGSTITLSEAVTIANPTLIFAPIGATTGQTFTFSATAPTSVELAMPSFAPQISHWGTSVIMDGRFDDDKSLIFTYGTLTGISVPGNTANAILSIRLAPSVDNGQIGNFGAREVINRMQLKLDSLGLTFGTATQPLLVTLVLNGTPNAATTWTNALGAGGTGQNSSLAQIATHAAGVTISGGEIAGGFFINTTDRLDLRSVRDLGNSILGGGGTASNSQIYPDGPDTITVVVRNLSATAATVFTRLGWTEAQA